MENTKITSIKDFTYRLDNQKVREDSALRLNGCSLKRIVPFKHFVTLLSCFMIVLIALVLNGCIKEPIPGDGESGGNGGKKKVTGFPQLGGMLIGNPHNYEEAAYQEQIAQLDVAILGMYNGWTGDDGTSPAQAVNAIKSLNPKIVLGNYTVMTEVSNNPDDTSKEYARDKLNSEQGPNGIGDWWAYDAAGNHTDWSGAYGAWDTNLTLLTLPDSNGDHWPQWLASTHYDLLLQGVDFDIWYADNNWWRPRSNADWDRDGTNDSYDDLTVRDWWRDGQRAYYDRAKNVAPELQIMVNADSDLDGEVFPTNADDFGHYENVVHGAYMEHVMGKGWSVETWGGWELAMAWYQHLETNLLEPQMIIFDAFLPSTTDYQYVRYAFASCLIMGNGYFSASTDYNEINWYDEFDLNGTASTHWLGEPLETAQTAAWQNGVYRRKFENGMVLVNPKGNGQQTVTIEAGYSRFQGDQAPSVNNGQPVTTLTLNDRDGILLIKD